MRWYSWQDLQSELFLANCLSPESYAWLQYSQSMTAQMRQLAGSAFNMQVVYEGWETPLPEEAECFKQDEGTLVWAREVVLGRGEQTWMWARTVFPLATITQAEFDFKQLGDRPLGEVLFANNSPARSPFQYAYLTPHHLYYQSARAFLPEKQNGLWMRRSQINYNALPLLLCEIFFPALFAHDI